jgi:hypothetical protein
MNIEILEPRIAPAALVTFTDVDGDIVTISVSKGTTAQLAVAAGDLSDGRLQSLDLASQPTVYAGANISITAKPALGGTGDGRVNVGEIMAAPLDLGTVLVDGDLGRIRAGDGNATVAGLKSLTVLSLGHFGTTTGAVDLFSFIAGNVGSLTVQTNLEDATFDATGLSDKIGSVSIGGSLTGTNFTGGPSGQIVAHGIGSVFIGGDLVGGSSSGSGRISVSGGDLVKLIVKGSILGGNGSVSGLIDCVNLGSATIGGDVIGGKGAANDSGALEVGGTAGPIVIGGSLIGGAAPFSGSIRADFAAASLTTVKIGRNLVGGAGDDTGAVLSGGAIKSITIGGDMIGGAGNRSGRISADVEGIGAVTIRHDFRGGLGAGTSAGEIFTSGGIGSVSIGGDVIGGSANRNGLIQGVVFLKKVTIGGNLVGGTGGGAAKDKGTIYCNDALGTVTIGGDLIGGGGTEDGSINAKSIVSVKVGGDVRGGTGELSGAIVTFTSQGGKIGPVTIGGSLLGGAFNSGRIYADGDLGVVKIGGDLEAGTGNFTGYIEGRRITSVAIAGSVIGSATTNLSNAASISARADIGSITIGGSVRGSVNDEVIFSAQGSLTPTATADVAIKTVKIVGNMQYAEIRAGATPVGTLANTNAQITTVTIGGSFQNGEIYAGTLDGVPPAAGISKIASVLISGEALGAIASHKIGAVKVSDSAALLTSTADTLFMGPSGSLLIRDAA